MQNNNMATPKQKEYMVKNGYAGNVECVTKEEASEWISWHRGQSQPQQTSINVQFPQQDVSSQYGATQPPFEQPQQPAYQQPQYQQPTAQYQQSTSKRADVPSSSDLAVILKDNTLGNALATKFNELVENGELYIPANYNVGNALRSAIYKIMTSEQADKLMNCTTESKQQALMEYVVQGLDASKTQCYFIPYGNKMTMMRSYFGDVQVCKRTGLVSEIYANVIYDGDEIEIGHDEFGIETLIKHETSFANRDNDIIGAYACAITKDLRKIYCFMTRKELSNSWKMSKMQNGKLLTDYKQEASKRSVIRRLVKMIFNTSLNTTEEQTSLIGSYNRTTEDEFINDNETPATAKSNIEEHQRNTMASETPSYQPTYEYEESNQEPKNVDSYDI